MRDHDDAADGHRLRILLIAPCTARTPPVGHGPHEALVSALAGELKRMGHDVTIFATGDSTSPGHLAFHFPAPPTQYSIANERAHVEAAFAYASAHQFDVVHSFEQNLGLRLFARYTRPQVTTMGWLGDEALARFISGVSRMTAERFHFVAASVRLSQVVDYIPWTTVVHHGIPVEAFPLKLRKSDYLLYVGRMNPQKGAHVAIDVARSLKIKLVIAGPATTAEEDHYLRASILPEVDDRNVTYIGEADHATKVGLMGSARALLAPILWEEPFGLVMVEAMACGTPVIAFARGSVHEIVVHDSTGFIVEDVDEMTEAVKRVDTISPLACRVRVREEFSASVMALKYVDVYRSVLDD